MEAWREAHLVPRGVGAPMEIQRRTIKTQEGVAAGMEVRGALEGIHGTAI